MELGALTVRDGTVMDGEICIVGAGPAGLSLAYELHRRGRRVVLLESAGADGDRASEALNAGECDGLEPAHLSRARGFGGTAGIWNTWFGERQWGKYLPLDRRDFTRQGWCSWSGWPFGREALDPHYETAQGICGLHEFDYRALTWADEAHPLLDLRNSGLESGVFQYGPAARFTRDLPDALRNAEDVHVVGGATVTGVAFSKRRGRCDEVRWLTSTGKRGAVRADTFVLAGGAIENARMLLLAAEAGTLTLPSGDAVLGRGFMEHPVDRTLLLVSGIPSLTREAGFYAQHVTESGPVMGRLAFSHDLLEKERLHNASVRLLEEVPRPGFGSHLLGSLARRVMPAAVWQRVGSLTSRAPRAAPAARGRRDYRVWIDLEQAPHQDNRVALSSRRDSLGMPRVRVRWRWSREDQLNLERLRRVLIRELEAAKLGQVRRVSSDPPDPNTHHHAGTTRMDTDPQRGVVDADLRVHGSENLYVAGSSVFPTAGFANPTLTVVALSVRLAKHLAGVVVGGVGGVGGDPP